MVRNVAFQAGLVHLLLVLPLCTFGQVESDRALSYIRALASDSLQGRRSGLPGGERAAQWIADQFQAFGLQPGMGDCSYFQNFYITTAVEAGPMVMRVLPHAIGAQHVVPLQTTGDPTDFVYGKDFVSFAYGGAGAVQGQVVFIGYGIQEPEKGRDDFAGVDLHGKIALALRGAPPGAGEGFWGREGGHGYKLRHAYEAGAIGYLQVGDGPAMQRTIGSENYLETLPSFWISRSACDRMLHSAGLTVDSLFARADGNPTGNHLELPVQLMLEAHAGVIRNVQTRNVVGYLPGSDPQRAHEIVLIGAHMDHLGVDAIGRIYHGADDNASGTALVMEMARALAQEPRPPVRSVYFVAFAGEDLGLLGSEEFVAHPPIPLDSVVTMINMDMVGQGREGISLGGAPNFPKIWQIWETALHDSVKSRISHFKPGGYSDHAAFEAIGIPAFFVASRGDHPYYHQPEDDPSKIQAETLQEIGEAIYAGVRVLADHPLALANPNRLQDYLWQSSETVQLGSPVLPVSSHDDSPDLILYTAGQSLDLASRHCCGRLLREIEQTHDIINTEVLNSMQKVESFATIPTGGLFPALALGLAKPVQIGDPKIYPDLRQQGVLFVRIPLERSNSYFRSDKLKKSGQKLLDQLAEIPQVLIWETEFWAQADILRAKASKPMVVRIHSLDASVNLIQSKEHRGEHFIWFPPEVSANVSLLQLENFAATLGWRNIGLEITSPEAAYPLLKIWVEAGYSTDRIRDLLGLNLIRFLQKYSMARLDSSPVSTSPVHR